MNSRGEVLAKISSKINSVHSGSDAKTRAKTVAERLASNETGIIPDQGSNDLVEYFMAKAEAAEATVVKVKAGEEAAAISDFLRQHNLPQEMVMGSDERLANIDWGQGRGERRGKNLPEIKLGASDGRDLVGLAHASTAASETGTLVISSGADNPSTNNFLPENHIVVLDAANICWSYEECWAKLRKNWPKNIPPRTLNMITGPSRSADIEQTLILGAHGPIRLHIVVVEE